MSRQIILLLGLVGLTLFSSCSKTPSAITVNGIFPQDDSLVFTVDLKGNHKGYQIVGSAFIKASSERQSVSIPIQDSMRQGIEGIELLVRNNQENNITLQSIALDDIAEISGVDLMQVFTWRDVVIFQPDSVKNIISCYIPLNTRGEVLSLGLNPTSFYQKKQAKIERISTVLFLFILLVFVTRQVYFAKERSFLCVFTAIFLSTLPLNITYTNWALLLFAIASLILFITNKNRKINIQPAFYGIAALYISLLIGLAYTIDISGGLKELSPTAAFLIFPILFSINGFSKNNVEVVLLFFVRFIGIYCLFLLTNYCLMFPTFEISSPVEIIRHAKVFFPYLFPYPSFTHPSFVFTIITMAIPIAVYLRFGKIESKIKWFELLACIGLVSTIVILSGARIGLIVIPLVLCLGILFYLRIKQWIKYLPFAATFSTVVFAYFHISAVSKTLNDPIRGELRKTAIAAIKEKPLFGWGTGSMKHLLYSEEIAHKAGLEKPIARFNHFHNQYLDEIVQFGFMGSLVFFGLFAYLIYLAIKRRDFLLMAYLTIYLPFMFVESPFSTVKGIQPMIFWLCFFLSTQKIRCPGKISQGTKV